MYMYILRIVGKYFVFTKQTENVLGSGKWFSLNLVANFRLVEKMV